MTFFLMCLLGLGLIGISLRRVDWAEENRKQREQQEKKKSEQK
jgi:hypothetical protein